MTGRIAFQGEPGAYSHQACRETRPTLEPLPCRTFEDVIEATKSPIETKSGGAGIAPQFGKKGVSA